jgi:agmatine deiminase
LKNNFISWKDYQGYSCRLKTILAGLVFFLVLGCQEDRVFRMPAEFEPQEAVWLTMFGHPMQDQVTARVISTLHNQTTVNLVYNDPDLLERQKPFLESFDIDLSKINFVQDSITRLYFLRDPGPLFLVDDQGNKAIADFAWNRLGNIYIGSPVPLAEEDYIVDRFSERLARRLNLPLFRSDFVAEGGGLEVNGRGLLVAVAETSLQRNPGRSLAEIEEEYKTMLGCSKVIWLDKAMRHDWNVSHPVYGNFITSGGNGHIDEMARFVNDSTILLAEIKPEEVNNSLAAIDRSILERNNDILTRAVDQDGQKLKIIRVPFPDAQYFSRKVVLDDELRQRSFYDFSGFANGDTILFTRSTSYLNFFISNEVVLIPAYYHEGMADEIKQMDEEVLKIFTDVFPERRIVQIDPFQINRAGGGIHCATQPQPL